MWTFRREFSRSPPRPVLPRLLPRVPSWPRPCPPLLLRQCRSRLVVVPASSRRSWRGVVGTTSAQGSTRPLLLFSCVQLYPPPPPAPIASCYSSSLGHASESGSGPLGHGSER